MADLYMNYDCDINCTNLFETICSTLSKVANPDNESAGQSIKEVEAPFNDEHGATEVWQKPRLNILNRLALEGLLAVIDGIARRCRASPKFEESLPDNAPLLQMDPLQSPPDSGNSALLGNLVSLNNGSSRDPSEYDFCSISTSSVFHQERNDSVLSDDVNWLSKARHHTSLALRERKLRKRRLAKSVVQFNEWSKDKEWIEEAERLGILPTPASPSSIASFLYSTPKLDKTKVGLYLSKGPKEIHPFHAQVLKSFASLFDFRGMAFSESLRVFLGRFRLPGEAQCIDRLMEAFAVRLHEVQLSVSVPDVDQSVEKSMLDPPRQSNSECVSGGFTGTLDPPAAIDEVDPVLPFKSSDAAFIMSFSTIMLNTDLREFCFWRRSSLRACRGTTILTLPSL
jgi:brefeldin A-resistance guanine nucleotide exchange factor 1